MYGDFRKVVEPRKLFSQLASFFVVIAGDRKDLPATNVLAVLQNPRLASVNRNATQNEAQKDRHIQPGTPAHQEMVFPDDEHARRRRARRVRFTIRRC